MSKSEIEETPLNHSNHSTDQSSKLLAICRLSGTSLYVKKFDDSLKYDEHLLGIGINALRIFLMDSFKRINISTIKVDELTIRMTNIEDVIIYYIYAGRTIDNEIRFNDFVERLVTMDCWIRFCKSEYNIFNRDSNSISLIVEEIFGG